METLLNFWNGEISSGVRKEELEQIKALFERNRKELEPTLNARQKKLLENCCFCSEEAASLFGEEAFCRGFSLGLRLAAEALFGVI